jgi:hypothetical protein
MTDELDVTSAPGQLVPFKKGEDPRRGRGPRPGAPNAGRPPDAVRAACRAAFDARVPMLAELADSGPPEVRLRALEMLARYGLGTSFTLENQERLPGVILLPELELRNYTQLGSVPAGLLGSGDPASDEEFEYVIEEIEAPARQNFGERLAPEYETVSPEIVQQVLARRPRY